MRQTIFAMALGASLAAAAFAAPPEGKGKPPKDDGGGGSLAVGYDFTDRRGQDWFGLSALDGTNRQQVAQGTNVSYHNLMDIAPRSAGNFALINDWASLYLIEWSFDASGNVNGSTQILIEEEGLNCAAFSPDGSRFVYSLFDRNLYSVPTHAPQQAPTLERQLAANERFGYCDFNSDGSSITAAIISDFNPGSEYNERLSNVPLDAQLAETVIIPDATDNHFFYLDVGPSGELAWGTEIPRQLHYDHGGVVRTIDGASSPRYNCDGSKLIYKHRHPKNGKSSFRILDLDTGLTSTFPAERQTWAVDWYC